MILLAPFVLEPQRPGASKAALAWRTSSSNYAGVRIVLEPASAFGLEEPLMCPGRDDSACGLLVHKFTLIHGASTTGSAELGGAR